MDRQPPRTTSNEIDLYIRTYYSLLRSSGDVRVRGFEEAHLYSASSLHAGALAPEPDLAAFAYSAARLPECFHHVRRMVLGQSIEQLARAGFPVSTWQTVRTRGRRRPLRWDGGAQLAVFVASASDIDDLVPIIAAYQIEWNKLHLRLAGSGIEPTTLGALDDVALAGALGTDADGVRMLRAALGGGWADGLAAMARTEKDLTIRLLDGSFREYQRSAQTWWSAIEQARPELMRRPVYFVSSNTHSLANLLGGYAFAHQESIATFLRTANPEGLGQRIDQALAKGDDLVVPNLLYYGLRAYLASTPGGVAEVQAHDARVGITTIESPARIDVAAQVFELAKLDPRHMDPRVRVPGMEQLVRSNAVIVNIDYPLGMAAYHHLAAVSTGIDEIRGMYIMGKAATLNARVGDVMISKVVHDEHSGNTYLLRNSLHAHDVQPFMKYGTVLDNQKALTVRSAFLQNRSYMDVFYREGYTVMEMEAGPYLSAIHETAAPQRHPKGEIVNLTDGVAFDLGVIHYASDTPYSRRQSLLSKSMSFFGMESTYACALAIARRILRMEIERAAGAIT
ncbi:MAG TPA: hypothetical protein VM261_18920 [Kofleriaceae bacterium]|nr:hypothetical protein [Kofleriaceae bacterium]